VPVRRRTFTVRAIALLGAASAAIHQLRYAIGYGDGASRALAAHPHGYLTTLLPGIATALVITLAAALMRLARRGSAREGGVDVARASLPTMWLACAVALAAIFSIQETLEGAGAAAHGGWIGLALALPVGLLVALALRGADAATVRAPGATLRVRLVVLAPVRIRARTGRARLLDLRIRSRGPPPALPT
jgi:hypothetical protein